MLKLAVVICVVLWSAPAEAIKWDFDDGTTQGWSAKEAAIWGGTRELYLFPSVVEDGVWTITVDPYVTKSYYSSASISVTSSAELISPTIGYDSGLFDHVRIRFRTVHDHPTEGSFSLAWTNKHNAGLDREDFSEDQFVLPYRPMVYTTEWQEVVIALGHQDETTWEGLLKDIQLSFVLERAEASRAGELVKWLEIDWIELTGVEELLQGELAPPDVDYFRWAEAGVFAPPVFYPIASGIGEPQIGGTPGVGVLTDLDGDGDLDLFAVWRSYQGRGLTSGWLMALNDGQGALELRRLEELVDRGQIRTDAASGRTTRSWVSLEVLGADLTGDGQDEIVLSISNNGHVTEVWSIDAELQVEVLVQIKDRWLRNVADWDGDGRVELFVGKTTLEGSLLEVWDVAQGVWTAEEVGGAERYSPSTIGDFTGDGALDVLWVPIAGLLNTWILAALGEDPQRGEIFEFDEWKQVLGVGDFDGDGQVDFLTEFLFEELVGSKGLALQQKRSGDRVEAAVLHDERLFRLSPVEMRDLNADGVEDWVFIGGDRASGFGVFVEWGGSVRPTQAGERHRLEGRATTVLSGDMDGDGDADLVALDPILGGVHVLKSSLGEQATAVLTTAAVRPAQHRLGDSYPNPFNPAVVIPLDLATDATQVSLMVYDVLGRRVRQLWDGPLAAGSHRFVWNGSDEAGKVVAAGVYIYQVEIDGQVEAKKTTKLP
ncbi:MAG: T9SS type A sorting domain-containing protein [Gemmatimonadetes bacterium]|nr:T9SS type A sorting domain-containing protein [Gemmatimonadota bacterium]